MQSKQEIILSDKNRLEIDAVSAVKFFDENGVLIVSSLGEISIEGKNLKIENFEKTSSKILITGDIVGVFYLEKRQKKKGRGAVN